MSPQIPCNLVRTKPLTKQCLKGYPVYFCASAEHPMNSVGSLLLFFICGLRHELWFQGVQWIFLDTFSTKTQRNLWVTITWLFWPQWHSSADEEGSGTLAAATLRNCKKGWPFFLGEGVENSPKLSRKNGGRSVSKVFSQNQLKSLSQNLDKAPRYPCGHRPSQRSSSSLMLWLP